ncbi:MAG TPA: D-alanine--D-alanine ligase [Rickettsiales bacterium]|nr:D-alanine--D-alanine ligase [Rickettsiales bacterium]
MNHIAVLLGGLSAEREVSLVSGKAIIKALEELGYKVTAIDAKDDVYAQLQSTKPDAVFNALHGRWGEDGCVQGMLELMKLPYTHSGVLASALAMDKPMAKKLFAAAGLNVAESLVAHKHELFGKDVMARPYVVKPFNEGSSVGVKILHDKDNFFFSEENWSYGDVVMVEKYVPGREITVAVLDGKALGVTEITTSSGFYDYDHKYTAGGSVHICPAPLPKERFEEVMAMAETAHKSLGCRGLTRSDFRYDDTPGGSGKFYILELNSQPGMTPLSLSPEIANYAGIGFNELVDRMIKGAKLGE